MPDQEQYAEIDFPEKGLDVTHPFGLQPPGTTRTGTNVRLFEPSSDRARGGSRPGIAKYIAGQVPSGTHLIQHINSVVHTAGEFTLDNYDFPSGTLDPSGPGWFWDGFFYVLRPRAIGRRIRPGGTGRTPNWRGWRSITFIQGNSNLAGTALSVSKAFSQAVANSNLLLAFCTTETYNIGAPLSASVTLSDSLGNTYVQAGTYVTYDTGPDGFGGYVRHQLSLWYVLQTAPGICTVTLTPSSASTLHLCILEYHPSSPLALDSIASATFAGGATSPFSTGTVTVSASSELLVGGFAMTLDDTGASLVAGTGFTSRVTSPADLGDLFLIVEDQTGLSSSTAAVVTGSSPITAGFGGLALGATFKFS